MKSTFRSFGQHIEAAIKTTFKVQFSTPVQIDQKMIPVSDIPRGDCVSQLGLSDQSMDGSLAIGFRKDVFLPLISKVFGEKFSDLDVETTDACGEMMNIIYANARRPINLTGHEFELSLPATSFGARASMKTEGYAGSALYFNCSCEHGSFWVCLLLKSKLKKVS